jgi:hypothetical protein
MEGVKEKKGNFHTTPPSSPPSNNAGQQPLVNVIDSIPCFSVRIYGPHCPQRKKLR